MPPKPVAPGSPRDWLRHARSDLLLASQHISDEILLETLCYHAQQAVEKSIKALLVKHEKDFPKTHNLKLLLERLSEALIVPPEIMKTAELTEYAVIARYPGDWESVTQEEYQRAVQQAKVVYDWAAKLIGSGEA